MFVRLAPFNETPYNRLYDFNPHLQRVVHQHLTYADFAALPESQLGFFTACFVRNPYDRVYSGFRQLQKDIQTQPKEPSAEPWIKTLVMKQLSDNFAKLCRAGFDFDTWLTLVDEHEIFEIGRNTSFPLHPAHYWTHLNGKQMVDFIGKVENFERDFESLCSRLGIEVASRANDNVEVDPMQTGADYKFAGLMSAASIARINELFREDFEFFDYRQL
jgi:hypothetical protein